MAESERMNDRPHMVRKHTNFNDMKADEYATGRAGPRMSSSAQLRK
jgi:hypothetical protein